MAFIRSSLLWETSTTTGTGTLTLAGAVSGYRTFGSACANNDTVWYFAKNQAVTSEFESGLGTWGTGGTLARTTILESSNAGAAVSFSAGTKDVFCELPAKQAGYNVNGLISFTRDPAAATGSVSYTGLGFKPTSLMAFSSNGTVNISFVGFCDYALTQYGHGSVGTQVGGAWSAETFPDAALLVPGINAAYHKGVVTSYDIDGFTVSWTKIGGPGGGVYNCYVMGYR